MNSEFLGLTVSQFIFAGLVFLIFVAFAIWGLRTRRRIDRLEKELRDFRELEPEGYEEIEPLDISEPARMEAEEEAARQQRYRQAG